LTKSRLIDDKIDENDSITLTKSRLIDDEIDDHGSISGIWLILMM
jgi:hypothetical protein